MFCLSDQTPAIGANEMQSAKKKLRTQSLVSKQRNFFTFKSYDLYFRSSGKPFIKKKGKLGCNNSYKGFGSA